MLRPLVSAALVLSMALVCVHGGDARADGKTQQKPKATKASVQARKQKLDTAVVAMRALADTPAPGGLTAEQRKVYDTEMQTVRSLAGDAEMTAKKLGQAVADAKADLDSMSEMGEMESVRLQNAMDRFSKMMATLSNLLKKAADTGNSIIQNLK